VTAGHLVFFLSQITLKMDASVTHTSLDLLSITQISSVAYMGCLFRIPDLDYFSIPDLDPGSNNNSKEEG